MSVRILIGDCRDVLRTLPDESVHCVVTSPPYWGLRDYGVAGQIGLESDFNLYVAAMVEVFRDVRRVLRSDGTLWLNLGDSYAGSGRGGNPTAESSTLQGSLASQEASMIRRTRTPTEIGATSRDAAVTNFSRRITRGTNTPTRFADDAGDDGRVHTSYVPAPSGLKQKDLMGMPWRVAFALQADGWYLRQDIIWSKPNPMPESVRDRCTKAHEYLFLLSKSERYYYDADAIKEPAEYDPTETKFPDGWDTGAGGHGAFHRNGREKGRRTSKTKDELSPDRKRNGEDGSQESFRAITVTRNKRSVWEISTAPFPEAHFATFPPALIEPCIKAGCPAGGVILDPFGGAGTAGLVADRLQRDAILIELNPEYAAMAERRIRNEAGMMAQVVTETCALQHAAE